MRLRPHVVAPLLAVVLVPACEGPPDPGATATPPAASVGAPESAGRPLQSVGGLQGRRTRVIGVVADLVSAERRGGTLAVTVRFRNSTREPLPLPVGAEPRPTLLAGGREWPRRQDVAGDPRSSGGLPDSLGPAETRVWRAEFEAPPPEVREFDLALPGVDRFVAVPIQDPAP